ncbi:MAG: phosphatidylserine decarboxylase [Candidatus Woesearchaeota archaeon]
MMEWWLCLLFALVLLAAVFLLFYKFVFLRDPVRSIPPGRSVVSPADGKVIEVLSITSGSAGVVKGFKNISLSCSEVGYPCSLVSIFMSPFDVHVNRAPFDGKVVGISYRKGSFLPANSLQALQNERNEVLLNTSYGRIKVVQIAGFIARRIECWVKKGDGVTKGEKFGRINLGSQAVLILPKTLKIRVHKGQSVKAGETVIAEP